MKELYSLDWSPDGKSLAYGWQDEIWIVQEPMYERSHVVSIYNGGRIDDISWSPGGQYLAFHGHQLWNGFWGEFIWVVKADGAGLKNLTADPPFYPLRALAINEWLDDHSLTINLWQGTGVQSLWQVDVTSGKATPLIDYEDSKIPIRAHGGSYNWSPTHEYIAINHLGYGHLVLVNVSQASEIWFSTMEEPPREVFRGWSQDGQRFLYCQREKEGEGYSLWLWDVTQGKGEKLLPRVCQAALSPDGSRVAFLRQEERPGWVPARVRPEVSPEDWPPALTAGVLNLETGETFLYGPAGYKANEGPRYWQGGQPVWSPDGEIVVYWGEEGDIWAASADGRWRQRLTQGMEIIQVLWSPDGGKLALRSFDHAWIIRRPVIEK
jgi:dipeptidyl aminopeptidase/acylaminoacyl peptidase